MSSPTLSVGKKNRRITIQSEVETQNSRGEPTLSWSTFATIWAEKQESAGGEGVVSSQLFATRMVRFVVWYRADITSKMRVVEGSRTFEIKAPPNDPDGRKVEMELLCIEMGV